MWRTLTSRYALYSGVGLAIVVVGLLLGALRDLNQLALVDPSASGFQAALIRERLFEHTIEQWLLLGLAFLKLGIGSAIATIVLHLTATGQRAVQSFLTSKEVGEDALAGATLSPPRFTRAFVPLLFLGLLAVAGAFGLTVWWDVNAVHLLRLESAGAQQTAAYQTALLVERVLDHLIKPGKFVGTALLILGIALGLATIIVNLIFQARMLPRFIGRLFGIRSDGDVRPQVPARLVALAIAGALVAISGTVPLAILRSRSAAIAVTEEVAGRVSSAVYQAALTWERVLEHLIDPWIFVGLAAVLLAINFLLLTIIRWLRVQRSGVGELVGAASGVAIPPVEHPLWTTRLSPWFAGAGFLIVLFFLAPLSLWRAVNELRLLGEQFGGRAEGLLFQQALRTELVLEELIKPGKFIGLAALLVGVGLSLVTIVINLRLTALLLPAAFGRLFAAARGERAEPLADGETPGPLSLAPWRLFAPLLAGAVIVASAMVPLALLRVSGTLRYLVEEFAGRVGSAAFQSTLLTERLLEHSILPWKLFGMGLIFFAIGRFFSTIIGFVRARRQIIGEGVSGLVALAEERRSATRLRRETPTGKPAV